MDIYSKGAALEKIDDIIKRINNGEVFIYPTDTVYGIGCNANDKDAVSKLRDIKGQKDRPISIIPPSKEWIKGNCILNEESEKWLDKLPGPYTLILKLRNNTCISENVNYNSGTIGVRLIDCWVTEIISKLNYPIITTSANITKKPFMKKLTDLDKAIKEKSDFIIYNGEIDGTPSKLIDLTDSKVVISERN